MPSNALTLTTAYSWASIWLVTTGTAPHRVQMWNAAVLVPNAYLETSDGSLIVTVRAPLGLEVHTPPCLTQNEQSQARAGISAGSGSQVREKDMFPQWHLPLITMRHPFLRYRMFALNRLGRPQAVAVRLQ